MAPSSVEWCDAEPALVVYCLVKWCYDPPKSITSLTKYVWKITRDWIKKVCIGRSSVMKLQSVSGMEETVFTAAFRNRNIWREAHTRVLSWRWRKRLHFACELREIGRRVGCLVRLLVLFLWPLLHLACGKLSAAASLRLLCIALKAKWRIALCCSSEDGKKILKY